MILLESYCVLGHRYLIAVNTFYKKYFLLSILTSFPVSLIDHHLVLMLREKKYGSAWFTFSVSVTVFYIEVDRGALNYDSIELAPEC